MFQLHPFGILTWIAVFMSWGLAIVLFRVGMPGGVARKLALLLVLALPLSPTSRLDAPEPAPPMHRSVALQGQVVCVQCEHVHRSAQEQQRCRMPTHHSGIRTLDGKVWTLANLGAGAKLAAQPDLRGTQVIFHGTLFPSIQTVDVTQFEVVSGAS